MLTGLRDGAWLTPERQRLYSLTLIGLYLALIVVVLATSHGRLDLTGRPIGTDFSQVWVAGRSVLAGDPAAPFDPARHAAAQHAAFGTGDADGFYGWHYPPYFLAIAAGLALLPYLPALLVWQAGTLAFYAATLHRILPGRAAMLGALAFPGVIVNVGHGHNGFLTAGLMGTALLCLEPAGRRGGDMLAGAIFALVAYKPQFGLVVPIALLAARRWRAMMAAAATLALITAASIAAFGLRSWTAFLGSLAFTRSVVLEQGNTGWPKIQSMFAAIRMWGGSVQSAYLAQAATACVALAMLAWVWWREGDLRPRGAALLSAALLTTPYCLDYDMMLLAPALAMLTSYAAERGFRPWEKTLLAAIWLSPLLARLAAQTLLLPLGLAAIATLFLLACRRAARG